MFSAVLSVIKTGESGLTVFRLLTKDNRWKWVQANARLVYKNGKPDYIIATQRPLALVLISGAFSVVSFSLTDAFVSPSAGRRKEGNT